MELQTENTAASPCHPSSRSTVSKPHITLQGSWFVDAPRDRVFDIITDFESYPEHFPKVTESIRIVERQGDHCRMEAKLKSFASTFDVKMDMQLRPKTGFSSDNESTFGTSGHEEMRLEDEGEGTRIHYVYELNIHKPLLRIVAKPLIKWFAMKAWKKAVIDRIGEIALQQEE